MFQPFMELHWFVFCFWLHSTCQILFPLGFKSAFWRHIVALQFSLVNITQMFFVGSLIIWAPAQKVNQNHRRKRNATQPKFEIEEANKFQTAFGACFQSKTILIYALCSSTFERKWHSLHKVVEFLAYSGVLMYSPLLRNVACLSKEYIEIFSKRQFLWMR